jgi:hypothetical protein
MCFGTGLPPKQNGELPANAAPDEPAVTSATSRMLTIFILVTPLFAF